MKLVYLEEARFELLSAIAWYEECREGLGERFAREIETAETDIIQHPELWGNVGSGCRRKLLPRFPYGLIYHFPEAGVVEVVAVMHLHRQPGYWTKRNE
jgi:plasmid stabilization system protein ParE